MAGSKPTSEHIIRSGKNPDSVWTRLGPTNTPPNRQPIPRLCFSGDDGLSFDYQLYADIVDRSCLAGHTFFLDTCFITTEELAMMRCERGSTIEELVHQENQVSKDEFELGVNLGKFAIAPLTSTYSLETARVTNSAVKIAISLQPPWTRFRATTKFAAVLPDDILTSVSLFNRDKKLSTTLNQLSAKTLTNESEVHAVFDYYFALLAHRKLFGKVCKIELERELLASPTPAQVKQRVELYSGPAAWRHIESYFNSSEDPRVFEEEEIVVDAMISAIYSGRDVIVLTDSKVLVEQFWVMSQMLESHYRSWCVGAKYQDRFNPEPTGQGDLRRLFRGNAFSAELEYVEVQSAMPKNCIQIRLQAWLMSDANPNAMDIYPVGFTVEPAMREMFKCKIKNEMRSTDCLNRRNLHFQWSQTKEKKRFASSYRRPHSNGWLMFRASNILQ